MKTRPLHADDLPQLMQWLPQEPLMRRYQLDDEVLELALRTALPTGDILRTADAPGAPCCALAWTQPRAGLGRGAYLRLICVRPDWQGQGLGLALLEACEAAARARGQENLMLLVSDYNARAQSFYRRCGYVQAGVLAEYVLPGVDELLFWKRL
ncbi:MAG: GNAT family N-acetyltransferase [Anaerolineaceae bacterium]|nr:GNAT family N-acetyltransferase [Anaerolineaceae bacterium]